MATTFLTDPVDISPVTTGSWQLVDLHDYIVGFPADASGIIGRVYSTTSDYDGGWRKNGSTDDRHDVIFGQTQSAFFVGVDVNGKCQLYRGNAQVHFYVCGYSTTDATFLTNAVDVSQAGSWVDADISATAPSGTVFAVLEYQAVNYYRTLAYRPKGSTDNRTTGHQNGHGGAIIPVDNNRVFQITADNSDIKTWLVGYYTEGTKKTNALDVTPVTHDGTFQNVDLSADAPTNAPGAILEMAYGNWRDYRKNGSATSIYEYGYGIDIGGVGLDTSYVCQLKSGDTTPTFWIWGYFSSGVAGVFDETITLSASGSVSDASVGDLYNTRTESSSSALTAAAIGTFDRATSIDAINAALDATGDVTAAGDYYEAIELLSSGALTTAQVGTVYNEVLTLSAVAHFPAPNYIFSRVNFPPEVTGKRKRIYPFFNNQNEGVKA